MSLIMTLIDLGLGLKTSDLDLGLSINYNGTIIILKVNDSCERAVALATDYVRILTKDSTMRRKILQVVEADRKAYTDCSKATYDK